MRSAVYRTNNIVSRATHVERHYVTDDVVRPRRTHCRREDKTESTDEQQGDWNLQDWKLTDNIAGVDITGLEFDGL